MKLSARDKQRLQWGVLAVIGGAAVLYAYIHLLVGPLRQDRVDGLNQLADSQDQIDQAVVDLRGLDSAKAEVAKLQAALAVATNRFVIRPVLGSTLVSVQSLVEPIAQACGLQMESCVERGRMEVPVSKKDAGFVIERYQMEVTAGGDYAAVRDFVQALEKNNEYVCITDVEILPRADNTLKHKARICMEWPVFGEHKVEAAPPAKSRARGGAPAEADP